MWDNSKHNTDNCAVGHDTDGKALGMVVYPNMSGAGLWTTPSDLAVIVMDLLSSYKDDSGKLLSQAIVKKMMTPYGCVDFVGMGVFVGTNSDGKDFFIT